MTSNNFTYKLSICIPTFNRAAYLDINLGFLSRQPEINKVQIVVSDNCSSDNTAEVVKKYAELNIKYHKQSRNIGMSGNIDTLPVISDGEYIWFLGDDDIIAPNSIEKVLRVLNDNDLALCYVNQKVYNSAIFQKTLNINKDKVYVDGRDLFMDVAMTLQFLSAIIVNRERMIKSIGIYDGVFDKDRHVIQFLDVMIQGRCYLFSDPYILCDYTDDVLKSGNDYESGFNWIEMFFKIPNNYVKYARNHLGYKDKHLLYFKYYQNKQFMKTYVFHKKEKNIDKYKHITISDVNGVLFGISAKSLFILAYFMPPFVLKLLWLIFVKVRNSLRESKR